MWCKHGLKLFKREEQVLQSVPLLYHSCQHRAACTANCPLYTEELRGPVLKIGAVPEVGPPPPPIRHLWHILGICHKCLRSEYPFKPCPPDTRECSIPAQTTSPFPGTVGKGRFTWCSWLRSQYLSRKKVSQRVL